MKKVLIIITCLISVTTVFAQDVTEEPFKPSKTQFMIRGYGHAGFEYLKVGDEVETTYVGSTFAPIFLFSHGDNLLFETELEFTFEDNQFQLDFEYADVSYILNDYMVLRMGKFLLPFGTFGERLHPSWVNKFSNMPLGFGHDGIAPLSGTGIELRGALPIGGAKLLYYVYSTNGPKLNTGDEEPDEAGILHYNNFYDNNNNKALGGRIALLPISNSSLEIGASAYGGKVGDRNDPDYENVSAFLYSVDLSYVKQLSPLGTVDIKAQYNNSSVSDATYYKIEPGDTIPTAYTFDNNSYSYYAQLAYRPSMASNDILKNFELVGRYSEISTPVGSEWEERSSQWAFGINYWMSWRAVFKLSYQHMQTEGSETLPGQQVMTNGVFAHWTIGF